MQATLQHVSSAGDGLTQRAEASIGLRLPPRLSPQDAERELQGLLADLPSVSVAFVGHETAVRHPKDNLLTRAMRVAIRAHGGTPVFKVKTGTSDMNVVAPTGRCPRWPTVPATARWTTRPTSDWNWPNTTARCWSSPTP